MYLHFRFHANCFPLPWKIPEEISRRSMFLTKGSIYHITHMYIQLLPLVGCSEILRFMQVSTMFYICRYCRFTWYCRMTKRRSVKVKYLLRSEKSIITSVSRQNLSTILHYMGSFYIKR